MEVQLLGSELRLLTNPSLPHFGEVTLAKLFTPLFFNYLLYKVLISMYMVQAYFEA